MILVKSGLNSEKVSLMRPIYIEKMLLFFGTETSGLNSEGGLWTTTSRTTLKQKLYISSDIYEHKYVLMCIKIYLMN